MFDYIIAALFGIVQGITEFLPISSSGHLVILHNFFNIPISNELVFDVTLHFATLLAVVWFFKKDILLILRDWFKGLMEKDLKKGKMGNLILLATVPAGLAGFFLENFIESALRSMLVVVFMLITVGLLFIFVEKYASQKYEMNGLNWKKALFIGFAQALALIPGTSRSGITVIAGLSGGLKRKEAVRFSFLLSIPVILGAFVTKIPELAKAGVGIREYYILGTSFVFAYSAGFFAIKYFLKYSEKYTLNAFAYYRFLLGALVLGYFLSS